MTHIPEVPMNFAQSFFLFYYPDILKKKKQKRMRKDISILHKGKLGLKEVK